ncbi:hypothetical protein L210DRAFT_2458331 [Boletus edulis BED1]|uniref:Uncharacterized protein n=1 Tax=Boletus edulis BED1 TaxID=1328754 RepID=A0AAD4GCM4_BOLED|nr:hypothetical protein L210DRAFT_2458331 [Boletus edulis BED1]
MHGRCFYSLNFSSIRLAALVPMFQAGVSRRRTHDVRLSTFLTKSNFMAHILDDLSPSDTMMTSLSNKLSGINDCLTDLIRFAAQCFQLIILHHHGFPPRRVLTSLSSDLQMPSFLISSWRVTGSHPHARCTTDLLLTLRRRVIPPMLNLVRHNPASLQRVVHSSPLLHRPLLCTGTMLFPVITTPRLHLLSTAHQNRPLMQP